MNDAFTMRVRAAAVAGWWTVLIAVVYVTLGYGEYCWIMSSKPAWVLAMWGPDFTWSELEHMVLWCIAVFKLFLWMLIMGVVWLTIWARQMKKRGG